MDSDPATRDVALAYGRSGSGGAGWAGEQSYFGSFLAGGG